MRRLAELAAHLAAVALVTASASCSGDEASPTATVPAATSYPDFAAPIQTGTPLIQPVKGLGYDQIEKLVGFDVLRSNSAEFVRFPLTAYAETESLSRSRMLSETYEAGNATLRISQVPRQFATSPSTTSAAPVRERIGPFDVTLYQLAGKVVARFDSGARSVDGDTIIAIVTAPSADEARRLIATLGFD